MSSQKVNLDSLFGDSQGGLSADAPRKRRDTVDLNNIFKDSEEARGDVRIGKYTSIFDEQAKIEPPKRGIGRVIDDAITSVVGTNAPNPEDINRAGVQQVKAEEARDQELIRQRRAELGIDSPDRGYAMRSFDSLAASGAGIVGSTLEYAGRQFGIKSMEELGKKATRDAAALTPKEQDLFQKVLGGFGSALPIVVGGGAAGLAALPALGAGGAALVASGVGAALEAPSIAQEAYEGALKETGNEARAEVQGYKAAALNLPISFITNRLGIFGGGGGRALQTGKAVAAEGTEEGIQQGLTNYLGYQPTGEGVSESALVGGLTGGVIKQFTYVPDAKPGSKGEPADTTAPRPPIDAATPTGGAARDPEQELPEGVRLLNFQEVYQTLRGKPAVAAVLYQEATTPEQKELVRRAVDRAEIQREFQEALGDKNLLDDARAEMASFPEFTDSVAASLAKFTTEMPPANIFKAERRTPTEQEIDSEFDQAWEDAGYVSQLEQEADTVAAERLERQQNRRQAFQVDQVPQAPAATAEDAVILENEPEGTDIEAAVSQVETQAREQAQAQSERFTPSTATQLSAQNRPNFEAYFGDIADQIAVLEDGEPKSAAYQGAFDQMVEVGFSEADARALLNAGTPQRPRSTGKAALFDQASTLLAVRNRDDINAFQPAKVPASFNAIAKALGVDVVAYNYTGNNETNASRAGTYMRGASGRGLVAINLSKSKDGSLFVLGHEVFHDLERRFPAQAKQLAQEIKKYIKAERVQVYNEYYENRKQSEKTDSEIAADVMGQMFTDRQFWQSVAKKRPGLVDRVVQIIDQVIAKFRANRGRMEIAQYIDQYEQVRDMVSSFVADNVASQGKPVEGTATVEAMDDDGSFGQVNVRKGQQPAQPQQATQTASGDAQTVQQVLGLLREGKTGPAAKLFRERDLFAKGLGSFTELQKQARGETTPDSVVSEEDIAGVTFTAVRPQQPRKPAVKKAEAAPAEPKATERKKPAVPREFSPGVASPARATDTPRQAQLRQRFEGIVRNGLNMRYFEETFALLNKQIAAIDKRLKELDRIEIDGKTFVARNEDDAMPGLWGIYDENAYDRFEQGLVADKPSNKSELLAARRKLVEELDKARGTSVRSKARLYFQARNRMLDQMMTLTESAMRGGMPEAEARAVFSEFFNALSFEPSMLRDKPAVEVEEEVAGPDIPAEDVPGERVAMGIVADFKDKSITPRQLEELIDRGIREGDFTYTDLATAFKAHNMSLPRGVLDVSSQLSVRKRLKTFLAENGNSTAARQEWMVNMEKVVKLNPGALGSKFTADEVAYYNLWKQDRTALRTRRKITDEMRNAQTAEEAFPNLLFNRFRLNQVRNPDSIQESESTRLAVRAIAGGEPDTVYFEDVAYALRRRPDLKQDIMESMTAEEGRLFNDWVNQKKAAIARESEILAKAPAFATLRNMDGLDARIAILRTADASDLATSQIGGESGLLDSMPAREVQFPELTPERDPDTAGLVIGAYKTLQEFAAKNGVDFMNISTVRSRLRPGEDILPENRSAEPVVVTMRDGQQLTMSSRYSGELLNSIVNDGVGRAANYVDTMRARYGTSFYRSRQTKDLGMDWMDAGQAFSIQLPRVAPSQYEQQYVRIANAELSELPSVMDAVSRLNSLLVGKVDPDTGEILTDAQADQYAADLVDSLEQKSMMSSVLSATGSEMGQFGATTGFGSDAPAGLRRGEFGFGETVEQAGDSMRAAGPQATSELSTEEQLQEGVLSEADLMEMGQQLDQSDADQEVEAATDAAPEQETAVERETTGRQARVPGSLIEGEEFRFRRAPFSGELTNAIVAEHVMKVAAKWTGAPRINVLPNVQMLPEGVREKVMARLTKDAGAAGLFYNGEVYLFSDHIGSLSDAEFTLFHETYGHYGMRAFLGSKFDDFLQRAYNTNARIKAEVDALMQDKSIGMLEAVDEVLSDMAATNQPVGLVKQWMGRVIAGLRDIGMTRVAGWLSTKTDAEIGYTLMMARKAVQEGRPAILNGAPDEVRLAEARLPYEMFSSKGGETTGYARYNPVTQTYAVFIADGKNLRDGWNTEVLDSFEEAVALLRKNGKVERRLRSGLYIDNKIPSDLQEIPDFRISADELSVTSIEGIKNYGRLIKRNSIIFFQNEYKPVLEVIDALRAKGRIAESFDISKDLDGLHERRTAVRLEDMKKRLVRPLMELVKDGGPILGKTLADSKLDLPEGVLERLGSSTVLDAYLIARHAAERNKHIAAINPSMPDGGSGMFTADADAVLNALRKQPVMKQLSEISVVLDQLSAEKLAMMRDSGLISFDEFRKRAKYKNYVNLSGFKDGLDAFDDLEILAGSSKFSTRKDKRALGRADVTSDVLARTIQSAQAAVLNSSKNQVKQKLLAMLEVNYDPDFVAINKQAYKRVLDENGEVTEKMDESYIRNKNVMVVHVNGRPTTIEFKKTGKGTFADSIHGAIYPAETESVVLRALGQYNRIIGQMLTTWNPIWTMVNFTRDAQTLYFNSVADNRVTKAMASEMVKSLPAAMKAAIHHATDGRRGTTANQDWIRAFNEMRETGGATSFLNMQGLERQVQDIQDMIRPEDVSNIKKVGMKVAEKLEEFNIPIELAPRLAAYKVMRDNGYSKEEAAQYAGEITVNFNLRGSSKFMRNMYLFFNPAIQGSAKLVKLLMQNPKVFRNIALGMAVTGFLASVLARAFGGEDEDGIDKIDKIPVFKRATSLLLPNPFSDGNKPFIAIPIPYGWNAFFSAGTFMADTLWAGAQPAGQTAKRIFKSGFEAFSPIGSAGLDSETILGTLAKGAAPTAALPLLEIMLNENRFGAPIVKEAGLFGGGKRPDSEMAFDSVSPISAGIFKGLNKATGGDYVNAGAIDVNPGIVDHLISSYLPGLVAETYRSASWATRQALGYDTNAAAVPLVDRFAGKIPESYDFGMYRRAKEFVATKYDDFKLNPENRAKVLEEFPGLGGARAVLNATDSRIQDLREYRKNVERDESIPRARKVELINQSREREKQIVNQAVGTLLRNSPALKPVLIASE